MINEEILVVDDGVENLEVISHILEESGYEVATALNGDRALQIVSHHPPDLILLDIKMPGIDGFETCQKLKLNPDYSGIPVIFMTAFNETKSKIKGFELGAVDYITKPFQEQELLARIKTHLQLRQCSQNLERKIADRTHKLQIALDQINQFQLQLVQSEKMSTLGNLVAGVAHEINNPAGFLSSNLKPAENHVEDLLSLIDFLLTKCSQNDPEIQQKIEEYDLDFIREDLPKLLKSMNIGVERICHLSHSLRNFSRQDRESKIDFNIHDGIDSTLLILKHRTQKTPKRSAIHITRHYGDIPLVKCFMGQLNQVFMNILANAIEAFDEDEINQNSSQREDQNHQITIHTTVVPNHQVEIKIEDNGCGMKAETKKQIFDQGFTTKPIGKGTGLGMAIAYQIITEKHGGTITCDSQENQGTTFTIRLPIS
ncbi:MAG: response regulator [Cyanobacteriota bacterium]|nr:response regulator [Cyanobacteriota bacterium]